jgi:2-polyprenyl-3-methyl-5-hydroxy-6-metoxy-1,4-benzoquinol methylase
MNKKSYRHPRQFLRPLLQGVVYSEWVLRSPLGRIVERANERAGHRTQDHWEANAKHALEAGDSYVDGAAQVDVRNSIVASLVRAFAPQARTVLDLGCGGGLLAAELARNGMTRYVGVDISRVTTDYARKHIPSRIGNPQVSLEFAASDLTQFEPEDDASRFDLIVFNEVLYYLPVPVAAEQVRRYRQWLAPAGLFGISMYNGAKSKAIFHRLLQWCEWTTGFVYKECDRPSYGFAPTDPYPSWLVTLLNPR